MAVGASVAGVSGGSGGRGHGGREPPEMVFTVEVMTGPYVADLARAQAKAIRDVCDWVEQQRAAAAPPDGEIELRTTPSKPPSQFNRESGGVVDRGSPSAR